MIARLLFIVGVILTAPALAQQQNVGVGSGAIAVDPSKNVLDALMAAVTRLNDLAAEDRKRSDDLRIADDKYQSALRDAETRRVNELAAQKQVFDLELARGIRANVDASALLLATQVRELKTDTSDRIAKLEVFANEQRGRSSATDPASAQLYADVSRLKAAIESNMGVGTGRTDMVGWIAAGVFGVLVLLIGVAGLAFSMAERRRPHLDTTVSPHDREDAERYRQYVARKVDAVPLSGAS